MQMSNIWQSAGYSENIQGLSDINIHGVEFGGADLSQLHLSLKEKKRGKRAIVLVSPDPTMQYFLPMCLKEPY